MNETATQAADRLRQITEHDRGEHGEFLRHALDAGWQSHTTHMDFVEQYRQGTARAKRAHRFANVLIGALRNFLPGDPEMLDIIHERLTAAAFLTNAEIIEVPPEWDVLRKHEIELAMVERQSHIVMEKVNKVETDNARTGPGNTGGPTG